MTKALLPILLLLASTAHAQDTPTITVPTLGTIATVIPILVNNPAATVGQNCNVKITKPDGTTTTISIGTFDEFGNAMGGWIPTQLGTYKFNYGQPVSDSCLVQF